MLIPSSIQCKDQCLAFATLLGFFIPITVANVCLYSQLFYSPYTSNIIQGGWVVDLKKTCPCFNSESLKVTLFGKRVFSDVIKLTILRWGHSGWSGWALNLMTGVLIRNKRGDTGGLEEAIWRWSRNWI